VQRREPSVLNAFLNLVDRVAPRLAYYPRWAQLLFGIAFASVLVSAFIYIAAAPNAQSRLRRHLDMTATIAGSSDAQFRAGLVSTPPSKAFNEPLRYGEELVGNTAVVAPDSPYLDLLHRGGPIIGVDYVHWEASDYPPVVEVKLANTSRETVLAGEVEVDVASSRPDLEPIPVVLDSFNDHRRLLVNNEGWGRGGPVEVRYALEPLGTRPVWGREPYRRRLSSGLEAETSIDLNDALRKEGVDVAFLRRVEAREDRGLSISRVTKSRRLVSALGRFKLYGDTSVSRAVCFGSIRYRLPDGRDHSVRFQTEVTVWARKEGIAPPQAEVRTYRVKLHPSGRNYRQVVAIDEELKPGQAIRFGLSILVKQSSTHEFTLRVVTANGVTLSSRPFRMRILSPRTRPFVRLEPKLHVVHEPA
jgi:hypothetical protein